MPATWEASRFWAWWLHPGTRRPGGSATPSGVTGQPLSTFVGMEAPFALTETHRQFRRTLRKFAEDRIAPNAVEADRDATYPQKSFDACVELELPALGIPTEYGGAGADMVTQAIMAEELARVCASTALTILISKTGMFPVITWGTDELKRKYLPHVASGRHQASYCLSEADAGSDAAALRTRAVLDGDHYVLTGTKYWITNAGVSDLYTVFAVTDPAAGRRGVSCFLVESDWGVEVAAPEDKLGLRGSPTAAVTLDGVRVPVANRIGEEGMGYTIAMRTLDCSRPTIGAQAVGIAQGATDYAGGYMKERKAFGHAIADLQGLRFMLAEMAMRTEAARTLVYRACSLIDSGDPEGELTMVGAMAKCFASDTAMAVTTDAVQLLGGYGLTKDFPVERFMRDAKITQIYEGTNQIQRVVIAKKLLG